MTYEKLGRIRPLYKGEWSASETYMALDIVRDGSVSYIAIKDVPINVELNDKLYWSVLLDVNDACGEQIVSVVERYLNEHPSAGGGESGIGIVDVTIREVG